MYQFFNFPFFFFRDSKSETLRYKTDGNIPTAGVSTTNPTQYQVCLSVLKLNHASISPAVLLGVTEAPCLAYNSLTGQQRNKETKQNKKKKSNTCVHLPQTLKNQLRRMTSEEPALWRESSVPGGTALTRSLNADTVPPTYFLFQTSMH